MFNVKFVYFFISYFFKYLIYLFNYLFMKPIHRLLLSTFMKNLILTLQPLQDTFYFPHKAFIL